MAASRTIIFGTLAALSVAGAAHAQDQDSPSNQSVPKGGAGAIIKPAAKAAPEGPTAPEAKSTPPRLLVYAPPTYPKEAETQGLEASVTLTLDVGVDGKVMKSVVSEGAGHGFDEAAAEAGKHLEFDPARRPDGTPFAARIRYKYNFTLTPKAPPPGPRTTTTAKAGAGTIMFRGTVLSVNGDAPLVGVSITVVTPAGPLGATTNEAGVFTVPDLGPGTYHVTASLAGYDSIEADEQIEAGQVTDVKYRLTAKATSSLEVTVKGEKPPREVTKRTLERREIERIPGTNGDALRALQALPGVARPPALAGLLIVRGSAPQDTATFIDGTPVPIIYHFGGLSSVVPTEMLDKIDFYPGNFSAQYGRAIGGIVDVGLRSPKDDGQYHGLLQADLIDVRAMLEGPVPFVKGWTFIAGGRRSFLDAWFGPVAEAAGIGATQAPVYYDYQFMVETKPSTTSKFRVAYFGDDDAIELFLPKPSVNEPALAGSAGLHTAFQRLQFRFTNDFSNGDKLAITTAIGRDKFSFGLGPISLDLEVDTVSGRLEYTKRIAKGVILNTGLDVTSGIFDLGLTLPTPSKPGEPPNGPFSTRELQTASLRGPAVYPAGYIEAELTPTERLRLVPGVRVEGSNLSSGIYVSPRFSGRYDIFHEYPRTTVKGGVGMYVEAPQPQEAQAPIGTAGLVANRAVQYEIGFEQELTRQIEVSVDGFYKQLDQLVYGAPLAGYTNDATGAVIGGELLLKYKPDKRFFGWVAYTLSRSTRHDAPDQPDHLYQYDQTHILTVLGSYNLGHGWELGGRFRLASGNLTTPNVCDVAQQACDAYRINGILAAGAGSYVAIPFTTTNSERLPLFHALDIRVDKRWSFKSWQMNAYLDVQNAYNHANAEAIQYNYNYTRRSYVTGLPIIPSIGARAEF